MKVGEWSRGSFTTMEPYLESIGVGYEEGTSPPPLEINSGKCEIIRALNFGEDLF